MEPELRERFGLAPRHRNYDPRLLDKVACQDRTLVMNIATPEARKLYRMHREVGCGLHLKKGFMRLNRSRHGILYGKPRLEHDVADLLLNHFHRRFPVFHIALEHRGKTYVADTRGTVTAYTACVEETVKELEKHLPPHPLMEGLDFDDSLWGKYYDSTYIRERRNLKLMNRMMPVKHREPHAMETRMAKRCGKITDYLE